MGFLLSVECSSIAVKLFLALSINVLVLKISAPDYSGTLAYIEYIYSLWGREVTILGLDNEGDQKQVRDFWLSVKNETRLLPPSPSNKNHFQWQKFQPHPERQ